MRHHKLNMTFSIKKEVKKQQEEQRRNKRADLQVDYVVIGRYIEQQFGGELVALLVFQRRLDVSRIVRDRRLHLSLAQK